jgi:Kef-type K+ transport system membrane component KefB
VTGVVPAAATVLAVVAALALAALLVHRLGARRSPLGRRGVDWATSLGISAVLSAVLGLIMTVVNVGLTTAFPPAFLTSLAIGIVVGTPTAHVVVPRVLRLTAPLGGPPDDRA